VDISCDDAEFGQDWAPDNEIAIAVDPNDPNHLVAGSNDYYYRFNNANGSRQTIVPTGFFTSFDSGATWIDGQIPMRTGNGAGDPSPAFDVKNGAVLMAQLENVAGAGGLWVSQGNVSVSRSTDGGVTWSEPFIVFNMCRSQPGLRFAAQRVHRLQVKVATSSTATTPAWPWARTAASTSFGPG
jgi:hypothetical protein